MGEGKKAAKSLLRPFFSSVSLSVRAYMWAKWERQDRASFRCKMFNRVLAIVCTRALWRAMMSYCQRLAPSVSLSSRKMGRALPLLLLSSSPLGEWNKAHDSWLTWDCVPASTSIWSKPNTITVRKRRRTTHRFLRAFACYFACTICPGWTSANPSQILNWDVCIWDLISPLESFDAAAQLVFLFRLFECIAG